MIINADCTVFNRRTDKERRMDIWVKTVIRGVYWESSRGLSKNSNGLKKESSLFAVIPKNAGTQGKRYVKPHEYKAVSADTAFTLAPEDIIIKGIIEEDITEHFTIGDMQKKYDDFYFITECRDFRFGGLSHLEVSGK